MDLWSFPSGRLRHSKKLIPVTRALEQFRIGHLRALYSRSPPTRSPPTRTAVHRVRWSQPGRRQNRVRGSTRLSPNSPPPHFVTMPFLSRVAGVRLSIFKGFLAE